VSKHKKVVSKASKVFDFDYSLARSPWNDRFQLIIWELELKTRYNLPGCRKQGL
jgi:hypothetical protein